MKRKILAAVLSLGVSLFVVIVSGWSVTVNFFAYFLYENNCETRLRDGSTVLIVVSTTNNTFGALTGGNGPAGSFTDEPDDVIVGRLAFDSSTMGEPGCFSSAVSFNLGENGIGPGNPMLLVWYPGLSTNAAAPGPGQPYGSARTAEWVVPGDNAATINISVVTPAAGQFWGEPPNITESEGCARFMTQGAANRPPEARCRNPVVRTVGTNCTATVTAEEVNNGSSDPDGDPITLALDPRGPYPLGTNSVALIVADNRGNTNLCVTSIIVQDPIPPVVTCGSDLTVGVPPGTQETPVNFDPPSTSDNCGIVRLVAVPPPGSVFPLGTNIVTWTVTDTSGNTNSCQFRVIVREATGENQPPVARCRDVTRFAGAGCVAAVTAQDVDNGSSDPDGDPITLALDPSGPFSLGTNSVTLIVIDARGLTNRCNATVTVVDGTPPTVTCPADLIVAAPLGANGRVVEYSAPEASDNCGSVTVASVPPSGAFFPLGTNIVTVTAVDGAGNSNVCTFTIRVVSDGSGNAPPTVRCRNLTRSVGTNCTARVTAAEVDNGTVDPDGDPFTLSLNPSGPYPLGTNSVTLIATDNQGNMSSCTATIIVVDQTPPVLRNCPTDFVVTAPTGATGAVVHFTLPTATDECSEVTVAAVPPPGSTMPLGTNTVVCTAVDGDGNTNSCSFKVFVRPAGTEQKDLAVVRISAPKRVRLTQNKPTRTVRVLVTIQNSGTAPEVIGSLDGLVTLVAESLQPELCPNLVGRLTTRGVRLPVTLRPKKSMRIPFDVTYSVTCIPDLKQTTRRENHDDYRYVATVDRSVLDGAADANPSNNTKTGPVTDVVVWFK